MNMKVPIKFQIGSRMLSWINSFPSMTYPMMRMRGMIMKVTKVEFPRFSTSILVSVLLSFKAVVEKKEIVAIITMSVNKKSHKSKNHFNEF